MEKLSKMASFAILIFLPLSLGCELHIWQPPAAPLQVLRPAAGFHVLQGPHQRIREALAFLPGNATPASICTSGHCVPPCSFCASAALPPSLVTSAAAAVLQEANVKRLVVIRDETSVLDTAELATRLQIPFSEVLFNPKLESFRAMLKKLFLSLGASHRHLMVSVAPSNQQQLFRIAASLAPEHGLLNRRFFWILMPPTVDPQLLLPMLPAFANVMLFRNAKIPSPDYLIGLIADTTKICDACDGNCTQAVHEKLAQFTREAVQVEAVVTATDMGGQRTTWLRVLSANKTSVLKVS